VPAYFYHQIRAPEWEAICSTIVRRRFTTVSCSDLLSLRDAAHRAVALTVDDGWSTVWSVALPIARRYGVRLTLFLVPEVVEDTRERRSTLDDGVPPQELAARDLSDRPYLTWGEVEGLAESGLVDVESHSLHHGAVFASDDPCFGEPELPREVPRLVQRRGGRDVLVRELPPGGPAYPIAPALGPDRRYLSPAEEEGGRWETDEERRARLRKDLRDAKACIERRLPGRQVRILAPPWAAAGHDLVDAAAATGHALVMMGYPYEGRGFSSDGPIPAYARLKGDAIWLHLLGPVLGMPAWISAMRRSRRRLRAGEIP
jgi:Polysaccharide deacetylase